MVEEIWKDCKGYEGFYQVSNLGRVKSLERVRKNWTGGVWVQPEAILKPHKNHDGYLQLGLTTKHGTRKAERVHRLVAIAFIDNPDKLPEVNHKNGIRDDNRVENLEWVSHDDNIRYTHATNRYNKNNVLCITTGEIFQSSADAAKKNGGDAGDIRTACRYNTKECVKRHVHGYSYVYIPNPNYNAKEGNE